MKTIVIDPGHGGTTKVGGSSPNNAIAPNGLKEKDVLLDIATCLRDHFAGDHRVILTRDIDNNLSLSDRARVAQETKASVMVSLHFNGFDGTAQGTETFVYPSWTNESDRLASCVQNSVLSTTGLRDRGVKKKNLGVLKPTIQDACTAATLVELSFMDTAAEARRLERPDYIMELAKAVMDGVTLYVSDSSAWGKQRYAPQALPLFARLLGFVRSAVSEEGLEH